MFPIWFLPPNKPEKFPQTLNYISAFYKHTPVKFSFFSSARHPPPLFFKNAIASPPFGPVQPTSISGLLLSKKGFWIVRLRKGKSWKYT